jgi:hypothetical protein
LVFAVTAPADEIHRAGYSKEINMGKMSDQEIRSLVEDLDRILTSTLASLAKSEDDPEELLHQLLEIAAENRLVDIATLPLNSSDLHAYQVVQDCLRRCREASSKKPVSALHGIIAGAAGHWPPVWERHLKRVYPRLRLLLDTERDR